MDGKTILRMGYVGLKVEAIDGVPPCYLCVNVSLLKANDMKRILEFGAVT